MEVGVFAIRWPLRVALPEACLWVNADRTRLAQMVTLLLGNSAKFTEPGGEVRSR